MSQIPNNPITRHPRNLIIVFFGNTKYSLIVAKALNEKFGLASIITIPDRDIGRSRKLTTNPLKVFAQDNQIPVLTFDKLGQEAINQIKSLNPDFIVVADYGKILPKEILEIPKYAPLNVHHSLLPKYRGPSPAPAAILAGEKVSGVTIIKMTEKVDAGDILAQIEYQLRNDETTDSLLTKLNTLGARILIEVIEKYPKAEIKPLKQNESGATYTHRFKKEDGYIDLENPPTSQKLDRMIRALYPWPGVWCRLMVNGKWLMVKLLPNVDYPTIQLSNYPTRYLIQPEGKRPMKINEFKNGYPAVYDRIRHLFGQQVQS